MFTRSYFPNSYFPAGYFEHAAGTKHGHGHYQIGAFVLEDDKRMRTLRQRQQVRTILDRLVAERKMLDARMRQAQLKASCYVTILAEV